MIPYKILSTGSTGNGTIINGNVLIDCGIAYKAISGFVGGLRLVLLTHIHSDHFRPRTLHRIALERPSVRFGCCEWLVKDLVSAGVPPRCIDVYEPDTEYSYSICDVIPILLSHNVPNCGYKLHFPNGKVFYATDTNSLNGIEAKNYDLYMVEANYEDEEIKRRIAEKLERGIYPYEKETIRNHLSKAKCDDFIYSNIGPTGEYVYMHQHMERKTKNGTKADVFATGS